MKILIDNGHARSTPGKRSPDRTFFEWKFNREIAIAVVDELERRGYDAERIVLEDDYDVSLPERVKRVNKICGEEGKKNVIFISVHANAAGSGDWKSARGFSVYVSKNASEASKVLARTFYDEAEVRGYRGNRCVPKERYWSKDLHVLKYTLCPAILTENLFYDNREDLAILKSEFGKRDIIDIHVEAIMKYIAKVEAKAK